MAVPKPQSAPRWGTAGQNPDGVLQGSTLVERLVGLLRLPYPLAGILLGLLVSPPGYLLFHTLDSGSLAQAWISYFQGLEPTEPWQQVVSFALWTLHAAYAFWMIRYVRLRVAAAEPGIAPLLPGGRDTYRAAFQRLERLLPPLLLAVVLGVLFQVLITGAWRDSGLFGRIYVLLRWPLLLLAYGTALWAYVSALWGLVRLGRLPLALDFFHPDGRMGTKSLGAASLSITVAYVVFFGILALRALLGPVLLQLTVVLAILVVLGAILFFWPLWAVHSQMAAAKTEHKRAIRDRLLQAALRGQDPAPGEPRDPLQLAGMGEIKRAVADLKTVLALDVAERKLADISTWPLDTGILSKLAAVVLPPLIALLLDLVKRTLLPG